MERPISEPAPVVTEHAAVCRDVCENQCPLRHVQHYRTGLIVLPNKRMANLTRCILESPDTTNRSCFFAEAPWRADAINGRRIRFMLHQTKPHRRRRGESRLAIDDTLCEHVGSLFDYVDRHANHRAGTYPLAHKPVTSVSVSGPGRFPVALRLDRRDEALPQWEAYVATHCPDLQLPTDRKGRNRLHQQGAPVLLQDPECRGRQAQFRTTMALAMELVEEAIRHQGPLGVVVCEAWSLAEDLVRVLARQHKEWISLLQTNRGLETASFPLRDLNGWAMQLPRPHMAGADLVPLIPATASRPVTVGEHT